MCTEIPALLAEAYIALGELIISGLNAYVIYGVYKICNANDRILGALQNASAVDAGDLVQAVDECSSDGVLEYAVVRGRVQEFIGPTILSKTGLACVYKETAVTEVRSKYAWNFTKYSFDGRKYDTVEFFPFSLKSASTRNFFQSKQDEIHSKTAPVLVINDVGKVDLKDVLRTFPTYYESVGDSGISWVLEYILGLATVTGVQKTEKLLPVDEIITVIGKIMRTADGQYTLTAPSGPNTLFMLTHRSYEEIVDKYFYHSAAGYLLIISLGAAGAYLFYDLVGRLRNMYREMTCSSRHRREADVAFTRGLEELVRSENNAIIANNPTRILVRRVRSSAVPRALQCTVCHQKPRDVVLMNCRHFCICEACSFKIRNKCPVCRQAVSQRIRVFVS